MHTLAQLRSGKLNGITRLQLSENLTDFPLEILKLADSLEILDLSNNSLNKLPNEIVQLTKLKIIFASNNQFTTLPAMLGSLPELEMIGFKNNQINSIPSQSLPKKLRWLILTDNNITSLPEKLGTCSRLEKLALAGNQLTHLPRSIEYLHNLALVRLSANKLSQLPAELLSLPKLAWLAFAGNPFCQSTGTHSSVPLVCKDSYQTNQVLGQGASGVIYHANWKDSELDYPDEVAVKEFKGEITSDGYPSDELDACLQAKTHPNLVKSLAQVKQDNYLALVMELIPIEFFNLGLPPSLETCSRDTFAPDFSLSVAKIRHIVEQMQDVFNHLHSNSVCHGDLYAHNVLIDKHATMMFGDFGAASVYGYLPIEKQKQIKKIEGRALGYFILDLLSVCETTDINSHSFAILDETAQQLLA